MPIQIQVRLAKSSWRHRLANKVVWQGRHKDVTQASQGRYKDFTQTLQGCWKGPIAKCWSFVSSNILTACEKLQMHAENMQEHHFLRITQKHYNGRTFNTSNLFPYNTSTHRYKRIPFFLLGFDQVNQAHCMNLWLGVDSVRQSGSPWIVYKDRQRERRSRWFEDRAVVG